jgi:hypothetical protein
MVEFMKWLMNHYRLVLKKLKRLTAGLGGDLWGETF